MVNCQEFLLNLEEIALVGPDVTLPPELQEHQLGCNDCHDRLLALQETWLLLPAALEKEPLRPEFEAHVMQRIEAAPTVANSSDSPAFTFWKYALAASVLIALVGGTMLSPFWLDSNDPVAEQDLERIEEFARQMGKLEQLESAFASPELRYVSLTSIGATQQVQGYFVYDADSHEGHFFGYDLDSAEDRTYVLWLLDGEKKVVSSTPIDVNSDNLGATIVQLPDDISVLNEVVVSLESDPARVAPSADVRMHAKVGL